VSTKSFLQKVGEDFKKGLDAILPYAKTAGETAVAIFAPELGPLFNQTVNAVVTAEQNFAALGSQSKSGASKLSAVVQIAGGLVKQGLADAGKASDDGAVQNYINSVVTVLNSIPAAA
jgi:hypothetical protein